MVGFYKQFNSNRTIMKSDYLFYFLIFLVFFIFFAEVHPIIPFDADDWIFLSFNRMAIPSTSYWNPTKLFPECFQPFVGLIAAYVVSPLVGDYLNALVYSHAIAVTSFILLYLISLQKFLKRIFNYRDLTCYALIIIFILFHFLILRTKPINNEHLLFSLDANCYYNYTIPNLLCASLVLWLMSNDITKVTEGWKLGILLLTFYLALCSILFSTVILIAYIGSCLLLNFVYQSKTGKGWLRTYLKKNIVFIAVVIFWIIIQIIEANGRRAHYSNMETSLVSSLIDTAKCFVLLRFNYLFIIISSLSIGISLVYAYIKRNEDWHPIGKKFWILFLALFLNLTYLILLCSRVNPLYIKRGEVIFSYSFFLLLIVIICIGYLYSKIKFIQAIIPLLAFIVFFEINTKGKVFRDVQYEFIDNPQSCMELNRLLLDKIILADRAHQDSVVITVPDFGNWDNWPLSYNCTYVGKVLYKHNIIHRPVKTIYKRSGVVHQISEPFYAY